MRANKVALQIHSVAVIFYLRKTVLAYCIFFIQCSPVICLVKAKVGPHFRVETCSSSVVNSSSSPAAAYAYLTLIYRISAPTNRTGEIKY